MYNASKIFLIKKKLKLFTRYITGGQLVYKKLQENNVKHAFIYSGGAIMPLIDCFYDGNIKYFINTHEQNSGHAATGYAKSSNKPGVCIVTSGPGLTNMITPILDANNDTSPLIVISGQVPKNAPPDAFQECPATEITKSITKWSYRVETEHELSEVIDKAFYIATSGKQGCVHIDIPKCILGNEIDDLSKDKYNTLPYIKTLPYDENFKKNIYPNNINNIAEIINISKKPILYVGKGCNKYSVLLSKFAKDNNIPVTTTIHAMGVFDENEPLSLEFLGMHGNVAANYAIQNADCIIAIGSRFDDRTTGNLEYYAPEAKKASKENRGGIIHVNIEKNEINKVVQADYYYQGDSGDFLKEIIPLIKNKQLYQDWINTCNIWKNRFPFSHTKLVNKIKSQDVIIEINKQLYDLNLIDNTIFTSGVGNHQMYASQFIKWKKPNSFITSGSLGVMGTGLPYAIGVQIANPDKIILDIDGDGSFNHTLSDLNTMNKYKLPIKIAIMNDGHQSMVRVWEQLFYNNRITATELTDNPDYNKLAESFGINSLYVDNHEDLPDTIYKFLNCKEPVVCNFKVETDNCFPLVAPGKALDDLILSNESLNKNEFNNILPPN